MTRERLPENLNFPLNIRFALPISVQNSARPSEKLSSSLGVDRGMRAFAEAFVSQALFLRRKPNNFRQQQHFGRLEVVCAAQKNSLDDGVSKSASSVKTPHLGAKKRSTRSLQRIAQKIAAARDKFQKVSDEVDALQSSPEGFVLGSDLSSLYIGSTSLVQDLKIPEAPSYWGMFPEDTLELINAYLRQNQISEAERQAFLDSCEDILAKLRGWTHQLADTARPLLSSDTTLLSPSREGEALDAIIALLQTSGFSILPELPEVKEPPSPDSLPLGNSITDTLDPTLLRGSKGLRKHIEDIGIRLGDPLYYPYIFLATRGVSLVRKSGLLLPQKMRAIERAYFSWIRTPFALLLQPLRLIGNFVKDSLNLSGNPDRDGSKLKQALKQMPEESESAPAMIDSTDKESKIRKVRRVVPALKLERGWNAFSGLFLPSFTQEPSHGLMMIMYREIIPNRESIRREKREALMTQIRDSVLHAVNPVPPNRREAEKSVSDRHASVLDEFKKPSGEEMPVTLQLFSDVPWGTIHHFFPSTFILPATRDLLRIDALTFAGLVSALVTYFRDSDSAFIFAALVGSFISYSVRVGFGWRQALVAYKGRIASEKAAGIVARQRSCLDYLAALSAEEMLVDVCCVYLSKTLMTGIDPQKIQRQIFNQVLLTTYSTNGWKDWLDKEGYS